MTVRPPQNLSRQSSVETGFDILSHELRAEAAAALGHAGRKVEATLAALKAHQGSAEERTAKLKAAAVAVHAYFIQRELLGLRNTALTIRDYAIPDEVLVRLGAS